MDDQMDELSFDELLDASSEIDDMEEPVVEKVEILEDEADYENSRLKVKSISNSDENKQEEWEGGDLKNNFWNYSYEASDDAVAIKFRRLKITVVFILIFMIIIGGVGVGIYKYFKTPTERTDITEYARLNDNDLAEKLNMKFKKNIIYTSRVRVLSDEIVESKADRGLAVIYINDKQQGIFTDANRFILYGLYVGAPCDETFDGLTFKYNKTYMETVDLSTGKRDFYYLYNTKTLECMIVSIDSKKHIVRELGYFYDYNEIIKRMV